MLSMMYKISCFANQASNKSPLKVSNGMNDIFFLENGIELARLTRLVMVNLGESFELQT